jgi:hypothetical protein
LKLNILRGSRRGHHGIQTKAVTGRKSSEPNFRVLRFDRKSLGEVGQREIDFKEIVGRIVAHRYRT